MRLQKDEEKEIDKSKATKSIQIMDHLQAIVPVQDLEKIQLCPLVGGMTNQKQDRLLSYNPTIIIATPGRQSEQLNECLNPYLQSEFL